MSNFVVKDKPGAFPRNVSAGLTGVGATLIGPELPLVGVIVGVFFQLVGKRFTGDGAYEHIIDGMVDGSVALLAHNIAAHFPQAAIAGVVVSPIPPVPMAYPQAMPDDSDALIG